MNKRKYKKKVAELFSFKSPKSENHQKNSYINNSFAEQGASDTQSDKKSEDMASSTVAPTTTTSSEIAQHGKKRDVIVIGAGLSG
jgi:hypothetical protein